jgi:hypothetical protein
MRAYLDTEHTQLFRHPLTLASIGITREDGQELYLVSNGVRKKHMGPWFKKNVWPHIVDAEKTCFTVIGMQVKRFMRPVTEVIVRGGKNDFTILEALLGEFWFAKIDLEKPLEALRGKLPPRNARHHALEDARHLRTLHTILQSVGQLVEV